MVKTINELDRTFASNLDRLMKKQSFKQKELAKQAKINPITLNRILKLKQRAGPAVAKALADALGVTYESMYRETATTDLNLHDAASILSKLAGISPLKRKVILAILFDDPTLVDHGAPDLVQLVRSVSKAL